MNIEVILRNDLGNISRRNFIIGPARFLKHVAIAGQRDPLQISSFFRSFGMFLYFFHYFEIPLMSWRLFKFRRNPFDFDPTELGQFSNIVGRAVADMLAREISGARYTHNYESAMLARNLAVSGQRPDLYCDTGQRQFALEAKGSSVKSVSENTMSDYKLQAGSGQIPVHFHVACATYRIFNDPVRVKYYDPENINIEYNRYLSLTLARSFYSKIFGEVVNMRELGPRRLANTDCNVYSLERLGLLNCKLLIAKNIYNWLGMNETVSQLPFYDKFEEEDIFLDSDGIGIEIE